MMPREAFKAQDRERRVINPGPTCRTPRGGQLPLPSCGLGLDGNSVGAIRFRIRVWGLCIDTPGDCHARVE